MGSLISQAEKAALDSLFSDVFDTFKQTFRVWKRARIAVISTDPNYNFIMGGIEKPTYETIPQYQEFEGIIHYMKTMDNNSYMGGSAQLQERYNESRVNVRIKMKEDAYNYLKDCEKIELDGRILTVSSGSRQHGLFSRNFFTLFLQEAI